jgi:hypothetical protein
LKNPSRKYTPPLKEANVLFYLFNPTNSKPIDGEVELVDSDVSRLIKKVKAHEAIPMVDPKNKTGKVTLIGSSFGFRKVQHDFNLNEIKPDSLPEYISNGKTISILFISIWRACTGAILKRSIMYISLTMQQLCCPNRNTN